MATTIEGVKISEMTEISNITDDTYLLTLTNGDNRKIKANCLKGADNLSEDYLDLVSDNGDKYRMLINNDGSQTVFPIEAFTGSDAIAMYDYYNGLIINQIYGGGASSGTPSVSHSFIELYNDTGKDINLKGMYLFYTSTGSWNKLALRGIIPYQHSFLIRCNMACDPLNQYSDLIRCKIDKYDQEWDIDLSSSGFTVFLGVGESDPTEDDLIREKTNSVTGEKVQSARFIDLMAGNGSNGSTAPYFDSKTARSVMDRNTGVKKIDFGFNSSTTRSFNSYAAVEKVDFSTCDVSIYRPRSLADGRWDYYVNKLKLNQNIPNLVNICYGEDGEHTRTFTWQSKVTDIGYLKYRLIKDANGDAVENNWTKVETTREMVKHHDQDCTIHRVIIKNLEFGTYEYQAGEEGFWSDVETFEVKQYLVTSDGITSYKPMKILWTSDQQGWTSDEYRAWKTSVESIAYHEGIDFDWHLNTGDISQNASRSARCLYTVMCIENSLNCL